MRISSITKNAGKACNNRLYRHIRTFEKIIKNYFVISKKNCAFFPMLTPPNHHSLSFPSSVSCKYLCSVLSHFPSRLPLPAGRTALPDNGFSRYPLYRSKRFESSLYHVRCLSEAATPHPGNAPTGRSAVAVPPKGCL